MLSRIVIVLLLFYCAPIFSQRPSPCPEVFHYENLEANNRWDGVINIESSEILHGLWIRVLLDNPAELVGSRFGEVKSSSNRSEFIIKNRMYTLQVGAPILVKFFVEFSSDRVVPSVDKIIVNGKYICNGGVVSTTQATLHLSVNNSNPGFQQNVLEQYSTSTSRVRTTTSRFKPTTADRFGSNSDVAPNRPTFNECGRVAQKPAALISYGQVTNEGEWPWHAALYQTIQTEFKYICGGSLISPNHVITAAHCVTAPGTSRKLNPEQLIVYLGKYKLTRFGPKVVDKEILEIIVHPEYSAAKFFNDVAILKLDGAVKFTNFIRPCCLWEDDNSIESLVQTYGTVIGWGFDENHQLSETLMQAQMPVVSSLTCIYSNRDFFSQVLFEKNYCAGFRNGTSVCNGDSGGGMVFPKRGTSGSNTVWQLRGLVSVGVALQGKGTCDPSQYIIFTDVAKHTPWIKEALLQ